MEKEEKKRAEAARFEWERLEKERRREENLKLRCKGSGCTARGAEACKYKMCISHCPGCPRRGHDQKLKLGKGTMSINFILN